ncbi:MAG: PTS sugar transporter subunit IIB [Culicoidibacterales bacterium]
MKNILLVCAAGMSTSIVVKKMQEAAAKRNLEVTIWAVGESEAKREHEKADILLLGPQVRFIEPKMKELVDGRIPVQVMNMQAYGMMNGEKILDDALALIGE